MKRQAGVPLSVVLASSVPWDELRPPRGDALEPIHIYLPPSTREGTWTWPNRTCTGYRFNYEGRDRQDPTTIQPASPVPPLSRPDPLNTPPTHISTKRDRIPRLGIMANLHILPTSTCRTDLTLSHSTLFRIDRSSGSIEHHGQTPHRFETPTYRPTRRGCRRCPHPSNWAIRIHASYDRT